MVTNNILALSIKSDIIQQWLVDIDFKFYKGGMMSLFLSTMFPVSSSVPSVIKADG